jgi:hypothetical protein
MIIYSSGKKDTENAAQEAPAKVSTMFVENRQTQTFGWVLKSTSRPAAVPELTLHDRRELAAYGMNNAEINTMAKRIFAAGGKIKNIKAQCKISIDYAKRLHAAFGRALKKESGAF